MNVPFLDLKSQLKPIRQEIDIAISEILDNTAFAGGPAVNAFESAFAEYCGTRHAVGVGSGTAALWSALMALEIGPGDEVITVPNTFIATVEAIALSGAKPVLVDVDSKTYTMDPRQLEGALTSRTKAIIPVHLFGQPADMDPIMDFARANHLFVIEDACQAHGAEYKGRGAGSIGDIGCFSFYPGKNLGAFGEAGAITTNREDLAQAIRILRDHGQSKKYHHDFFGWNERMDGIQGAVLNVKLKYLDEWNLMRRAHAESYNNFLRDEADIILPEEANYARHVYHLFAVRVQQRDEILQSLAEHNVYCGIHYPIPVHLTGAFRHLASGPGSFPVSEQCANEFLSLPMFAELQDEQIRFVSETLIKEVRTRNRELVV